MSVECRLISSKMNRRHLDWYQWPSNTMSFSYILRTRLSGESLLYRVNKDDTESDVNIWGAVSKAALPEKWVLWRNTFDTYLPVPMIKLVKIINKNASSARCGTSQSPHPPPSEELFSKLGHVLKTEASFESRKAGSSWWQQGASWYKAPPSLHGLNMFISFGP